MTFKDCDPNVRFYIADEAKPIREINHLKTFCDGSITFREKRGSTDITRENNGMLYVITNDFQRFEDEGVQHRVLYHKHKTKFVKEQELVPDNKNLKLENEHLSTEIWSDESKSSIFFLFAQHASNWMIKKRPQDSIFSGDSITYKSFLDNRLLFTGDQCDIINVKRMLHLVRSFMPEGNKVTEKDMISNLALVDVRFNKFTSCGGVKGVFFGFRYIDNPNMNVT